MPPSNAGYFVAAYIAAAIVYVGYGLSIVVRKRRLRARLAKAASRTIGRP